MKQITLNFDSNDLRDKIMQLRALTDGLDNIHHIAVYCSDDIPTYHIEPELLVETAHELGISISAELETKYMYTELLDSLANVLEETLYTPKTKTSTF